MSFRILNRVANFRPMFIQHLRYSNKKYLDTHEWFIPEGNQIKLGLSEKGLELMNDIVFIDDDIDTEGMNYNSSIELTLEEGQVIYLFADAYAAEYTGSYTLSGESVEAEEK